MPDECDPLKRPMRRYTARVGIHSNDRDGLIRGLREIAQTLDDGACHDFRGGDDSMEFSVRLGTDYAMTPEKYADELLRFQIRGLGE